jgi:hypothetical protein
VKVNSEKYFIITSYIDTIYNLSVRGRRIPALEKRGLQKKEYDRLVDLVGGKRKLGS